MENAKAYIYTCDCRSTVRQLSERITAFTSGYGLIDVHGDLASTDRYSGRPAGPSVEDDVLTAQMPSSFLLPFRKKDVQILSGN